MTEAPAASAPTRGLNALPVLTRFDDRHPLVKLGFKVVAPPVSSSSISAYYQCKRAYFWRYRLGLVHRTHTPSAATEGTWMHEAIRAMMLGGDIATIERDLTTKANAINDSLIDSTTGISPAGVGDQLNRAVQRAVAMANAFLSVARIRNLPLVDPDKTNIIGTEQAISCQITLAGKGRGKKALSVTVAGTLDLITGDKASSVVTIHDYKRVSGSPADRAQPAYWEPQVWLYPILANAIGHNPTWFNHWIIQSPTIRQKQTESFVEYLARVVEWYKEKSIADPNDPPMIVSSVSLRGPGFTPERVAILAELAEASQDEPDAENYPRTGAPYACKAYNRLCPYCELCSRDPALWPDAILTSYRQEFRYEQCPSD